MLLKIPKDSFFTIIIHPVAAEKKTTRAKAAPKKSAPGKRAPRKKPCTEKHVIGFLFFICLLLTGFLGTLLLTLQTLHIPDLRTVANYTPAQATVIYDRHGQVVERVFTENRTVIPLSRMHPLLPKAFVAAEDGRFFEHPGLDMFSVLRAAINNIIEGRRGQGGSTITQQVARALLLTPEKTYIRKFKEAILAWRIDTLLTKEEILYIYLNQIYLGAGAYGVESASQVYFGKHAANLSLSEVAILAGLPQAPSRYSPIKHRRRAVARQKYVLNRMAADGYVSAGDARNAYLSVLNIQKRKSSFATVNGYYLDVVKAEARKIIGRPLEEAGARIYTHLDQGLQRQAQRAVTKGTKAVKARQVVLRGGSKKSPQGALVCMDRNSSRVRALVGGTDFGITPFNRATMARRPAGSIFKPFVYASALQSGWQPLSVISDAPLAISSGNGGIWRPKNYSGQYHGDTTLATALAQSYNVAAVRLMQKVGVKKVHALAQTAGISADLPPDLSLALGAADVTLLEMTAAYGSFANKGGFTAPSVIERIEHSSGTTQVDRGRRLQALPEKNAMDMRRMLIGVVENGTGKRARGLPGLTGGKTGTSDENRDAWFIGFNGNYLAGVWVGHDRNQSLGASENGGRTAVPIWREFMGRVRGVKK